MDCKQDLGSGVRQTSVAEMPRDFRDLIRREHDLRRSRNPYYSLRSLARDLGLSPSRLSEVLNGQKMSRESAKRVALNIGLRADEAALFCDLVDIESAPTQALRDSAKARVMAHDLKKSFTPISEDQFRTMSDWWHAAIIELTYLETFISTPDWIAKILNIPKDTAEEAVERLLKLGLLEWRQEKLKAPTNRRIIECNDPSTAIRSFHKQISMKARAAIDEQDMATRFQQTMFLPVAKAKIPSIFAAIEAAHAELLSNATRGGAYDALYCIATQCFLIGKGD